MVFCMLFHFRGCLLPHLYILWTNYTSYHWCRNKSCIVLVEYTDLRILLSFFSWIYPFRFQNYLSSWCLIAGHDSDKLKQINRVLFIISSESKFKNRVYWFIFLEFFYLCDHVYILLQNNLQHIRKSWTCQICHYHFWTLWIPLYASILKKLKGEKLFTLK